MSIATIFNLYVRSNPQIRPNWCHILTLKLWQTVADTENVPLTGIVKYQAYCRGRVSQNTSYHSKQNTLALKYPAILIPQIGTQSWSLKFIK